MLLKLLQRILKKALFLVEISVADEDAGKVIGRQGRVIKAIRTLCRAAGSRNALPLR